MCGNCSGWASNSNLAGTELLYQNLGPWTLAKDSAFVQLFNMLKILHGFKIKEMGALSTFTVFSIHNNKLSIIR